MTDDNNEITTWKLLKNNQIITKKGCACCGYHSNRGVIYAEDIPRGSGHYEKRFACERCASMPFLLFPFTVLTVDGLVRPLQSFLLESEEMGQAPVSRMLVAELHQTGERRNCPET